MFKNDLLDSVASVMNDLIEMDEALALDPQFCDDYPVLSYSPSRGFFQVTRPLTPLLPGFYVIPGKYFSRMFEYDESPTFIALHVIGYIYYMGWLDEK